MATMQETIDLIATRIGKNIETDLEMYPIKVQDAVQFDLDKSGYVWALVYESQPLGDFRTDRICVTINDNNDIIAVGIG